MRKKSLSILGSTGSVGAQAVEVARHLGLPVSALAAGKNDRLLEDQARLLRPRIVALADEAAAARLKIALADTGVRVLAGPGGVMEAAAAGGDTVVSAVTGIKGLLPTLAAVRAGREVALANKESLVCAGELLMAEAEKCGAAILPVDSEHSAVFQCLQDKNSAKALKRVILTASGGPFFGRTRAELAGVTVEDALRHPNWRMGRKITVDSATLMNKGLELIEAMRLYRLAPEQVDVIIHRESVIHSMVEFSDGAVLAQMSVPDMRLPIQYALTYPERMPSALRPLDFAAVGTLSFAPPDEETFPCLALARRAATAGGTACAALNGANEAAVSLFLSGEIGFLEIAAHVGRVLAAMHVAKDPSLAEILEADEEARQRVLSGFPAGKQIETNG